MWYVEDAVPYLSKSWESWKMMKRDATWLRPLSGINYEERLERIGTMKQDDNRERGGKDEMFRIMSTLEGLSILNWHTRH